MSEKLSRFDEWAPYFFFNVGIPVAAGIVEHIRGPAEGAFMLALGFYSLAAHTWDSLRGGVVTQRIRQEPPTKPAKAV